MINRKSLVPPYVLALYIQENSVEKKWTSKQKLSRCKDWRIGQVTSRAKWFVFHFFLAYMYAVLKQFRQVIRAAGCRLRPGGIQEWTSAMKSKTLGLTNTI